MPGTNEFPGDYTDGETPDPIPNSEAKPVWPMVVLTGESRSSPGIYEGRVLRGIRPSSYLVVRIAYCVSGSRAIHGSVF